MGVVWVAKPESKNSIYQLDDVQFCWKCGLFYLAKPELLEVQSSVTSTNSLAIQEEKDNKEV